MSVADSAVDPFLLPGERVLFCEAPRARSIGSAVFDSAIGCGCLGVFFFFAGSMLVGSAIQALRGHADPTVAVGATAVAFMTGWYGWSFFASIQKTVREHRQRANRRYVVTTKRVLLLGTLEEERILELAQVEGAVIRPDAPGVSFLTQGTSVVFTDLEDPKASLLAIEAALDRARAEPT